MDTQKSLLTYVYNLLTTDPDLQIAMGSDRIDEWLYLTWATPNAEFPYLVHRIDIRREPGTHVIQRASYYLDIWSDSPNADEILLIRKWLIELLDELVFSTSEVARVHIGIMSDGFVPESEQGIWHYATLWDIIFRRDSEAVAIEGR